MNRLTSREKRLCAIVCNAILVALELVAALISTLENGWSQFQFYTQNSNYFALIASVIFLVVALRGGHEKPLPKWVTFLRYTATCLLSVTFLVIVLILAPPYGWTGFHFTLFTGAMTFQHLLCPILSFCSLFFFEDPPKQKGAAALSLIPTFFYAILAVILNLAKVWHGPYSFFYVYEQPWWQSVLFAVMIPAGAYLVASFLLWGMRKRKKGE